MGHQPVMLREMLDYLQVRPNGRYVDGTFGGGGYAHEILKHLGEDGRLLGLDLDPETVSRSREQHAGWNNLTVIAANYRNMIELVATYFGGPAVGIVLDLGLSSLQLDAPERGFGHRNAGPLDMRFDRTTAIPATRILNEASADDLAAIFAEYGEVRHPGSLARAIIKKRVSSPIATTGELSTLVATCCPREHENKTLAQVFQALRIVVNNELENLETFLETFPAALKPGGRLVVVSYHSLEDRRVKQAFLHHSGKCTCLDRRFPCRCADRSEGRVLTRKPPTPGEDELRRNPRSRSARLRAFEREARG